MICENYLKITEANKNKNASKFKFQGQSTGSQRWFDLGFGWIEVNFSACEPELYRTLFQRYDDTQNKNIFKMFEVPIGNSKLCGKLSFTVMPQCSSIVKSH